MDEIVYVAGRHGRGYSSEGPTSAAVAQLDDMGFSDWGVLGEALVSSAWLLVTPCPCLSSVKS